MNSATLSVASALLLAGAGLSFVPDSVSDRLRCVTMDFMRPGQQALCAAGDTLSDSLASFRSNSMQSQLQEQARLKTRLEAAEARSRELIVRLAMANDERNRAASQPPVIQRLPRLSSPSLIEADVLGSAFGEQWRSGGLLDRGAGDGVQESSLIVNNRQPLIDLGGDGQLSPEDALLLGRCVIGKVEHVGRWSSTFLLLTDASYRGRAQLIHETDSGFAWGARGLLKGQGTPLCLLTGITPSEAVNVGDAVYTADRDGNSTAPLYYGRVVEASLGPDAREWHVLVEPVALPGRLKSVQVLRNRVNTERLAAARQTEGDSH